MANDTTLEQQRAWLTDPSQPETKTEETVATLLVRIQAHLTKTGWSEGYFSKVVAGDVSIVSRLRNTGKVTGAVQARVERYLNQFDADQEQNDGVKTEESAA